METRQVPPVLRDADSRLLLPLSDTAASLQRKRSYSGVTTSRRTRTLVHMCTSAATPRVNGKPNIARTSTAPLCAERGAALRFRRGNEASLAEYIKPPSVMSRWSLMSMQMHDGASQLWEVAVITRASGGTGRRTRLEPGPRPSFACPQRAPSWTFPPSSRSPPNRRAPHNNQYTQSKNERRPSGARHDQQARPDESEAIVQAHVPVRRRESANGLCTAPDSGVWAPHLEPVADRAARRRTVSHVRLEHSARPEPGTECRAPHRARAPRLI
ncbi:hypothetical protein BC834DRAFT_274665 [Gloeopeniophorella convolvens]|nr:hypothetical protein BC834DRAFT_274665 [Gloeopeniophorella convolvens]